MGVGRDTSNVFSAPLLLVLTSSECVCCRLGEMARGQAGVLPVWPSGSVQFKVELGTVRGGDCVYLANSFTVLRRQTGEEEETMRDGARRQACPFCLVLNELIDKQGFSLSVRMKHKQALQPRAGVVGE